MKYSGGSGWVSCRSVGEKFSLDLLTQFSSNLIETCYM